MATVPKFKATLIPKRTITEVTYTKEPVQGSKDKFVLVAKQTTREVLNSYMVSFPGGHQTWFENQAAMRDAGLFDENELFDTETGLPIRPNQVIDLDEVVRKRTVSTGLGA